VAASSSVAGMEWFGPERCWRFWGLENWMSCSLLEFGLPKGWKRRAVSQRILSWQPCLQRPIRATQESDFCTCKAWGGIYCPKTAPGPVRIEELSVPMRPDGYVSLRLSIRQRRRWGFVENSLGHWFLIPNSCRMKVDLVKRSSKKR
jgi:hypothetical protein